MRSLESSKRSDKVIVTIRQQHSVARLAGRLNVQLVGDYVDRRLGHRPCRCRLAAGNRDEALHVVADRVVKRLERAGDLALVLALAPDKRTSHDKNTARFHLADLR